MHFSTIIALATTVGLSVIAAPFPADFGSVPAVEDRSTSTINPVDMPTMFTGYNSYAITKSSDYTDDTDDTLSMASTEPANSTEIEQSDVASTTKEGGEDFVERLILAMEKQISTAKLTKDQEEQYRDALEDAVNVLHPGTDVSTLTTPELLVDTLKGSLEEYEKLSPEDKEEFTKELKESSEALMAAENGSKQDKN